MNILIASPEAHPFARNGELAEVIYGLAQALVRLGHRVIVVIPGYRQVREGKLDLIATGKVLEVPLSLKTLTAEVYHAPLAPGLEYYFICQDSLYNREGLYGVHFGDYQDNAERFIFFSRAVVELIQTFALQVEVCHCHEWQTGLVPIYLRTLYQQVPALSEIATVYTVHNVGYQGIFSHYDMPLTGLGWDLFTPQVLEFYGKINLMKGGLVMADLISTVSQQYRAEILSPEFGFGLEGVLQERADDLYGILNGVDYATWDPARDAFLAHHYSPANLAAKLDCKVDLLRHFGMTIPPDTPLIGMSTSLTEQKGIDLVRDIFTDIMDLKVGFVLQGMGEERYQYGFTQLQELYPGQVGLEIGYSEELAHQIIAGSDIYLMTSRYEPCGLDQLYSLRYGTIPVVRATGGLGETVVNYNPGTGQGTGFTFTGFNQADVLEALGRALTLYRQRTAWENLQGQAMAQDFSWDLTAPRYVELYQKARQKRHPGAV